MASKIRLKVHRQVSKGQPSHFDTFEIPYTENMNVISALMEVIVVIIGAVMPGNWALLYAYALQE